jgi:hypothetical protein
VVCDEGYSGGGSWECQGTSYVTRQYQFGDSAIGKCFGSDCLGDDGLIGKTGLINGGGSENPSEGTAEYQADRLGAPGQALRFDGSATSMRVPSRVAN